LHNHKRGKTNIYRNDDMVEDVNTLPSIVISRCLVMAL